MRRGPVFEAFYIEYAAECTALGVTALERAPLVALIVSLIEQATPTAH